MSKRRLATFATEAYRADAILRELLFHPNLRTNDGIDWQSAMGGGPSEASAQLTGTATSTTATSLTNTGASFPVTGGYGNTSTSPLAGKIVCAGSAYGVIVSNTATVLTIDKWYNPASPGGAAASTPSGTSTYFIITALVPTWWMALTADSTAPAATDHALASEITTNGFARALGGWSHTNGTNTVTLNNLFTCSGGSTTINKEGVLNASSGGILTFESAEPSPPTLISGDTLSQSVVLTY